MENRFFDTFVCIFSTFGICCCKFLSCTSKLLVLSFSTTRTPKNTIPAIKRYRKVKRGTKLAYSRPFPGNIIIKKYHQK